MTKLKIIGAGGGKGGGGFSRVPVESQDSLRSRQFARILDLVSEGEVEGLVDGARSIFLDGTPLQNADGSFNFQGITLARASGTQTQSAITGFQAVESETVVNTELLSMVPVTRQLTNVNLTRARITILVPYLAQQNATTGDLSGTAVSLKIYLQSNGGGYVLKHDDTISGKTVSRYLRSYDIQLEGSPPWDLRVTRQTADSVSITLSNKTFWSTYTEIIDAKLSYPNSAVMALEIDSAQFSSIPQRGYLMNLLKIQIPTNYNPETREYTGIWDGTFQVAWSNNPAWVFYDLVTSGRYGLGDYVDASLANKWALYEIGQYCDGLVSDGFGGLEPRFTCNLYLQTREEAFKVLSDLASIFRGMAYWGGGVVSATADQPRDATALFTPANVVGGMFTYQGSSRSARHTVVLVHWNDPDDGYRQRVEYVEDEEGIARHGVVELEAAAFGCTSRGQAHRWGRWVLYTEKLETEIVTFPVGLSGVLVAPGEVVKISDPGRVGLRLGGRVVTGTVSSVTLDAPVTISSGKTYTLSIVLPDGSIDESPVGNAPGVYSVLSLSVDLYFAPQVNAIWVLSVSDLVPEEWRIVTVGETEKHLFEITAVRHRAEKYAFIDENLILESPPTSVISTQPPPMVTDLAAEESLHAFGPGMITGRVTLSWVGTTGRYLVTWRRESENIVSLPEISALTVDLDDVVPGQHLFSVRQVSAIGKVSPVAELPQFLFGKTAPPSDVTGLTSSFDGPSTLLRWIQIPDLDFLYYEVRVGSNWITGTLVGQTSSDFLRVEVLSVSTTYFVKAFDTTGHESVTAASVVVTPSVPGAISPIAAFDGGDLKLTWFTPVVTSYPISRYEVRHGATFGGGTSVGFVDVTTFRTLANWSGSRTWWVQAIDVAGMVGIPGSVEVVVTKPSAPVVIPEVIDNNVLLRWTDATQTLPIKHYEVRRGGVFSSATVIGTVQARFSVIFESSGGLFTYWVVGVDSAGNYGTEQSVTVTVSAPPDYILFDQTESTFGGTKTNCLVVLETGKLLATINATETFQQHFDNNSWASPQAQIDAGFPIYIEPSPTTGQYLEVIDYGTTIPSTLISVSMGFTVVSGSVTITPTISTATAAAPTTWTDHAGVLQVYATDFRYVKVTLDFTSSGGNDLLLIDSLIVRLDVKIKRDSGIVTANSGDSGGTTVNFAEVFIDIRSITGTPQGTTPAVPVIDFTDAPNPTSFKILVFDLAGGRITRDVRWDASGV